VCTVSVLLINVYEAYMRVLFMLEREESGHEIQRLAENGKD